MTRGLLVLLALALAPAPGLAQSNIANADLQQRPAGNLARTFSELPAGPGPFWIGYSVPARDADWSSCCFTGSSHEGRCCAQCSLEPAVSERTTPGSAPSSRKPRGGPVKLEGGDVVMLFRMADRRVDKIRAFSDSCAIDAGGRRVYWLTEVEPSESVALLATYADAAPAATGRNRLADGALMALAAHREPSAVRALIGFARNADSGHVRGQALFWLAHRAGGEAVGTIADAIELDPDTQVKTRAVFALSQLPENEGVPRLIEVARAHRNPKVRQQAIFWLGQSRDPRALEFFEEILLR